MNAGSVASVYRTPKGTSYLTEPGVALLAWPVLEKAQLDGFLDGFDDELEFDAYLDDNVSGVTASEELVKIAGQLCYMSFGPNRTKNDETRRYLNNIKEQKHGSVLEHANLTFLFYGIDRSVTHELVRHRAGMAYSQVSQRYVDGKVLRFVERAEFQASPLMHELFEARIDRARDEYDQLAKHLMEIRARELSALEPRDRRKSVNQVARALLPNETEAPIIVTGNARAWRHVCAMRASAHADTAIRALFNKVIPVLQDFGGGLFDDFTPQLLPDNTTAWAPKYGKV